MKRNPNLHPLSWDHHAALTAVVLVRRKLATNPHHAELTRLADQFTRFHADALTPHFRQEEEWLLPMLLDYVAESDPMILRVCRDHIALHQLVAHLGTTPDEPRAFKHALTTLLDRLEAHVRFEERELFPRLESLLTEDQMAEIGTLLHQTPAPPVVIPGSDGIPVSPGPIPRDSGLDIE